jgi:hypothetical protein
MRLDDHSIDRSFFEEYIFCTPSEKLERLYPTVGTLSKKLQP